VSNNCSASDFNSPSNDFDMRYTPINGYDFWRPILREFHTQIFNGVTSINNFSGVLSQLRAACESNTVTPLGASSCKLDVNDYFGQGLLSGGGLQNFMDSRAGRDAKPNVNGKVCQDIRARHSADQCGAWPT
jgi:hypothetical protein